VTKTLHVDCTNTALRAQLWDAKTALIPASLSTMQALTIKNWKNRICIRSSNKHLQPNSMISGMIQRQGEAPNMAWAKRASGKFCAYANGGDRDQMG